MSTSDDLGLSHQATSGEDFVAYLGSRTRLAQWRIRSRACAVADAVAATAGAALLILAAVDSITSWPSDRVLLDHNDLSQVAAVVLIPGWLWLPLAFMLITPGRRSRPDAQQKATDRAVDRMLRRAMFPGLRVRLALGLLALLCAAVVIGGIAMGIAKGSTQVLPGPRYEISTLDLNQAAWTPISASQYNHWQARFVREDGFFTLFGLVLTAGSCGLLQLHRTAMQTQPTRDLQQLG
ncbi:hypothetical protein [Streptacidiphilus albus]|uniref:hypothetical protein n=1 Tax=Streptacidiphilus albus TaxID=105425 RepID=UPI00128E5839|nr:hypothetical protein [Streptacidiphilus albus]